MLNNHLNLFASTCYVLYSHKYQFKAEGTILLSSRTEFKASIHSGSISPSHTIHASLLESFTAEKAKLLH